MADVDYLDLHIAPRVGLAGEAGFRLGVIDIKGFQPHRFRRCARAQEVIPGADPDQAASALRPASAYGVDRVTTGQQRVQDRA